METIAHEQPFYDRSPSQSCKKSTPSKGVVDSFRRMKRNFSASFTQLIRKKPGCVRVIRVARGVRGPMQMGRGINGRRKTRKKLGEDERKDEKGRWARVRRGRKVAEFDTGG